MALTEKGKKALNYIFTFYSDYKEFTAKELSVKAGESIAAATLNPLVKEGYLNKNDSKTPIRYSLSKNAQELYKRKMPKTFLPYSEEEMTKQLQMSYKELCDYLTNKYGIVDGSFFCNDTCRSVNTKIKRGKEGLYIHHIKEDTHIMLSDPKYAKLWSFDYQKGTNLVYCNIFEHFLLHYKIVIEYKINNTSFELPGIGGIINYIAPYITNAYCDDTVLSFEHITLNTWIIILTQFFNDYLQSSMAKVYPIDQVKNEYNKNLINKSLRLD